MRWLFTRKLGPKVAERKSQSVVLQGKRSNINWMV